MSKPTSPTASSTSDPQHGVLVRFTLDAASGSFGSATVLSTVDLAAADDDLQGFTGGFATNGYAYFVPGTSQNSAYSDCGAGGGCGSNSGKVARLDLNNFDVSGVEFNDHVNGIYYTSSAPNGLYKMNFQDGFTDGNHMYMMPYYVNYDRLVRIAVD